MLSYVGMLSVYASSVILSSPANSSLSGLALESLVTLLTVKFIPFFILIWIISAFLPLTRFVPPLTSHCPSSEHFRVYIPD